MPDFILCSWVTNGSETINFWTCAQCCACVVASPVTGDVVKEQHAQWHQRLSAEIAARPPAGPLADA